MADETKVEFLSADAKALAIAEKMVNVVFDQEWRGGSLTGKRWEAVNLTDEAAVKARLQEMADLIGDLKQRILK